MQPFPLSMDRLLIFTRSLLASLAHSLVGCCMHVATSENGRSVDKCIFKFPAIAHACQVQLEKGSSDCWLGRQLQTNICKCKCLSFSRSYFRPAHLQKYPSSTLALWMQALSMTPSPLLPASSVAPHNIIKMEEGMETRGKFVSW